MKMVKRGAGLFFEPERSKYIGESRRISEDLGKNSAEPLEPSSRSPSLMAKTCRKLAMLMKQTWPQKGSPKTQLLQGKMKNCGPLGLKPAASGRGER